MGTQTVAGKIDALREDVRLTAEGCGRDPSDIEIVLVSKTRPAEMVREAAAAGMCVFGENRVQELVAKTSELGSGVTWHMIGHLQTNKVKQVLGKVTLIQSLDRLDLLKAIEVEAAKKNISRVDCLVQVNCSSESSKFGLLPEEVEPFVSAIEESSCVHLRGLMTIGPFTADHAKIREAFNKTYQLREMLRKKDSHHQWDILSMGMSGDYKIAIEEGSTMIRVGSLVFGERKTR